jgi:hypothetical protein
MTHRLALLASLMLVAGAPCGAQSPASSAPASSAPTESATSSAKPSSSAASSSTTAPAAVAAGTDSTATASKAASSETNASSEPSQAVLKEARREGLKPKKRNGVTVYCHTDATVGTHFETEKCYDQEHMEMLVQQRQDQRNVMQQPGACTGSSCNGH